MNTASPDSLPRRALLRGAAAWAAASALPTQAAEEYPARPIHIVVPYAPGGSTDAIARLVGEKLGQALKQPVVIDNRPGANGIVGTELVARAAPDGYTLLIPSGSVLALSPLLYKTNFDPVKSFAPISLIASFSLILVANANLPATAIKEVIALAHGGTRTVSFATGTSGYSLMCENFKLLADAPQIINVPYNGAGPQAQAVLGGQVDLMIDTLNMMEMIRAGRLRALGIFSEKRSPKLPDLPTMQEQGIDMASIGYAALLAPAGTPPAIVQRLQTEIAKIMTLPDVREQFARIDHDPVGSTPEQLAAAIAKDDARYRKMVKDTNFKLQ